MPKQPLKRCSTVFTNVSLKNQRILYKSATYLKHSRISTMELSSENSLPFSVVCYFHKKPHRRSLVGV